jgi:hypothetical protein
MTACAATGSSGGNTTPKRRRSGYSIMRRAPHSPSFLKLCFAENRADNRLDDLIDGTFGTRNQGYAFCPANALWPLAMAFALEDCASTTR